MIKMLIEHVVEVVSNKDNLASELEALARLTEAIRGEALHRDPDGPQIPPAPTTSFASMDL